MVHRITPKYMLLIRQQIRNTASTSAGFIPKRLSNSGTDERGPTNWRFFQAKTIRHFRNVPNTSNSYQQEFTAYLPNRGQKSHSIIAWV
jgi:hypothetical protein